MAILMRTTAYRCVAYLSRNHDHRGVARPTAYRPVPAGSQYRCSTLSNRVDSDERAETDLVVGVTACSAEKSNNHALKPIELEIFW